MNFTKSTIAVLIAGAFPFAAMAQSSNPNMYERNVYQQQRIEQGLRDGSLTVQEAAQLERGQSQINRMESRAAADGRVTDAERARINEAQNRQSDAINRERNDNQRGNPNSHSAQRMADDVQRNANEQRRIADGVRSGQMTTREAARLEQGQSRISGMEARAGRDGRIDRYEQHRIQGAENHQSRAIHHERNDGQRRGGYDNHRGGRDFHRGGQQHGQWNQHNGGNGYQHASEQGREHGNWNHQRGNQSGSGTATTTTGHGAGNGTGSTTGTSTGSAANHGTRQNGGHTGTATTTVAQTSTVSGNGNRFGQSRSSGVQGTQVARVDSRGAGGTGGARGGQRQR